MPNHIHNAFVLATADAQPVLEACVREGRIDFETLIPSPPGMYHGNLSSEEDEDFPLTWMTWCPANWGTKWNAYGGSVETVDGETVIRFQTAWNAPRPVAAALANRFGVVFQHYFACEGMGEGWTVDVWADGGGEVFGPAGKIVRRSKRKDDDADRADVMRFAGCPDWTGDEEDEDVPTLSPDSNVP